MTPPISLANQSLLAVFAHPDDESIACGGLLALCADRGARVSVLCATHGESNAGVYDKSLFIERARELREAAAVLGVTEVVLLDFPDGFLPWEEDLSGRLESELRRIGPDVVVTFGEDGLYWHPDHIAIFEATTAAVDAMGDTAPALYYVTMPPGQMRRIVDELSVANGSATSVLGIANPDAFGADAAEPSLVVDVSASAGRKLAALKCHRSQVAAGALALIVDGDAPRLLGVEFFHRPAGTQPRSRPTFMETLG